MGWTEKVTVKFAEAERPFGDAAICTRMRDALTIPRGSRLGEIKIVHKAKDGPDGDFTFVGEASFHSPWRKHR